MIKKAFLQPTDRNPHHGQLKLARDYTLQNKIIKTLLPKYLAKHRNTDKSG